MNANEKTVTMATVAQAAQMFGLSKYLVRKLARQGRINAIRTEGRILINVERLRDYLDTAFLFDEL